MIENRKHTNYTNSRERKLAADDKNCIYDEYTIFKIGEINDIAEEIDINPLFNNIGKLYMIYTSAL